MDAELEEESEGLRHRVQFRDGSTRPGLSKHGTSRAPLGDDAVHYPSDDNHRFFESVCLSVKLML